MRRKLLEQMYDRMTDEEKRLFVMMTMQNRSNDEILQALQQQSAQLDDLRQRQQTFGEDFVSNMQALIAAGGLAAYLRQSVPDGQQKGENVP